MDILLSQLPPWFIAVGIVLIAGFLVYLITRSLREGREISFWPPRIGPKVRDETPNKSETVQVPMKENPRFTHTGMVLGTPDASLEIIRVNTPSEPIGIIRVTSGPSYGLSVFLTKQTRKLSFGRSSEDDTSVAIDDSLMSKQHLVIRVIPTDNGTLDGIHFQVRLFDLGSTNGTFVNNKRVQMVDLKNGDVIRAGGSSFQVYFFEGS